VGHEKIIVIFRQYLGNDSNSFMVYGLSNRVIVSDLDLSDLFNY